MKSLLTFLVLSLLAGNVAQAQTRPTTKPASTTTTARPSVTQSTNTTTTTARPTGQPPTTLPNRQQELYDQYHGITKKATSPVPSAAPPTERQASRPAPQPATPMPSATSPTPAVARSERPLSSDGRTSGVRIGVRGGVTYPVYLEQEAGIDPTVGFVGGVVFNFGRGTLSFQPELNYARYGVKARNSFSNSTVNVAADVFEVPLLLKIASGSANSTRFFLNIGPYGAYASSASINGQKLSLDNLDGRFSFGAAAGVGAALKAGPGHLTVELRGQYLLGNTESQLNTDSRVINTQATLGYMIPLGGR